MCDRDVIGALSIFKVIRSAAALARILPTCVLSWEDTAKAANVRTVLEGKVVKARVVLATKVVDA